MAFAEDSYINIMKETSMRLAEYYAACCAENKVDGDTELAIEKKLIPKVEEWLNGDTYFGGQHTMEHKNFKGLEVLIADTFPVCSGEAVMKDRRTLDKIDAPVNPRPLEVAAKELNKLIDLADSGMYPRKIYKELHAYMQPVGLKEHLDDVWKFYGGEYRGCGEGFDNYTTIGYSYRNTSFGSRFDETGAFPMADWVQSDKLADYYLSTAKFLKDNSDWNVDIQDDKLFINNKEVKNIIERFAFEREDTKEYFAMKSYDIALYCGKENVCYSLDEMATEHGNLPVKDTEEFTMNFCDEIYPILYLDYNYNNPDKLKGDVAKECMEICKQKGIPLPEFGNGRG